MEVPEESFHWSSWDSRTCYPRRAFIQGLTDDQENERRERRLTDRFLGSDGNDSRSYGHLFGRVGSKSQRGYHGVYLLFDMKKTPGMTKEKKDN